MFGNKTKVQMTEDEKTILILALNELRNKLLSEGRFTDAVDELSPTFYAWVFTFAGGIRIISPDRAVDDIVNMAKKLVKAEKK